MNEIVNIFLTVLRKHLNISSEDPHPCLRYRMRAHKLYINRPYPVMLGGWQGAQSTVHHSPCARYALLLHQKLAVVDPDARHLVHEDEAALKTVVDLVITRVCNATSLDLLPSHLQVKNLD